MTDSLYANSRAPKLSKPKGSVANDSCGASFIPIMDDRLMEIRPANMKQLCESIKAMILFGMGVPYNLVNDERIIGVKGVLNRPD
jgi:hypothetical protein